MTLHDAPTPDRSSAAPSADSARIPTAVVGEGLVAAAVAARLAQDPRFALTFDDPHLVVAVGLTPPPEVDATVVRLGTPDRSPGPPWVDARRRTHKVLDGLVQAVANRAAMESTVGRTPGALTPREQAVLTLIGQGMGRDDIAVKLDMSPNTVRTHTQNLRAKLGARSHHELVAISLGGASSGSGTVPLGPKELPLPWVPPLPDGGEGRATVVCGSWPVRLEGLALVCEASNLHVEACASSNDGALLAVTQHRAEVVVVAGRLSGTSVEQFVRSAKGITRPEGTGPVEVIVLADEPDDDELLAVVEAGAEGYLGPEAGPDELLAALDAAASGEPVIPRHMLGPMLRTMMERRKAEREVLLRYADLSLRERDILACLVSGMDHLAIAHHLLVSPHTARTHIQNTLRKLGAHSRAEVAVVIGRVGLTEVFARRPPVSSS